MALYQFPVTRRFNRYMGRLVSGSKKVRYLLDEGQIISAEKKYNKLALIDIEDIGGGLSANRRILWFIFERDHMCIHCC